MIKYAALVLVACIAFIAFTCAIKSKTKITDGKESATTKSAREHDPPTDQSRVSSVTCYNTTTEAAEPFFPFGYYLETDMCDEGHLILWDLIEATRSNTIAMPDLGPKAMTCIPKLLDGAQRRNLKVVLGIDRYLMAGLDLTKPATSVEFEKYINTYKAHPALLGWLMGDENDAHNELSAKATRDCATLIHKLDPHHSVWQVFGGLYHNNWNLVTPYLPGTDVILTDQYFETRDRKGFEGARPTLYHLTNGGALASQLDLSWGPLGQGFGNDLIEGLNKWRLPKYGEFRWNVFSAITASHARIVMSWTIPSKPDQWYKNPEELVTFIKTVVAPVYEELKQISHAMETGYNVGQVTMSWDTQAEDRQSWKENFDRISQLLVYDNEKTAYFLIVTNNDFKKQQVAITLSRLPAKLADLNVLTPKSRKTLTLVAGGDGVYTLKDTLENHEVVIYNLGAVRKTASPSP